MQVHEKRYMKQAGVAGIALRAVCDTIFTNMPKATPPLWRAGSSPDAKYGTTRGMPVLHADNGASMKSQTLQMKLHELAITPSHSRQIVSNDNAYMESLFRALKYMPQWPASGFSKLDDAREWVERFTQWYNETHRHSGIKYVTQSQRRRGEDGTVLKKRDDVYQRAKGQRTERWSGGTIDWQPIGEVMLNPEREKQAA